MAQVFKMPVRFDVTTTPDELRALALKMEKHIQHAQLGDTTLVEVWGDNQYEIAFSYDQTKVWRVELCKLSPYEYVRYDGVVRQVRKVVPGRNMTDIWFFGEPVGLTVHNHHTKCGFGVVFTSAMQVKKNNKFQHRDKVYIAKSDAVFVEHSDSYSIKTDVGDLRIDRDDFIVPMEK